MANSRSDYTDVTDVGVDERRRELLYAAQTECCVLWTNRAGWPVGAMPRFVCTRSASGSRARRNASGSPPLRVRPQSGVVESSEDAWLGGDVTTTAKTLASVHTDTATKGWFYPALAERQSHGDGSSADQARAEFTHRLDTPSRVIIGVAPVDWITYDGNRLEAALRRLPYDPLGIKPSRNVTESPTGVVTRLWRDVGSPD
jgi:hypothetical protein